ncbi:MAG: DNA photolyase family protein [Candidatus Eremiobacteraeota bacterium]|nr:DNA photolyase family protein [Candidatus Eremiobacteraeota bacterium]
MAERSYTRSIVWLRRDLRLADNVAIARAAQCSGEICMAFNLDPVLLRGDRIGAPIVQAFFGALASLRASLRERGSDLALLRGDFTQEIGRLAARIGAQAVFYSEDYDPAAVKRDAAVAAALQVSKLDVVSCLDHVYYGAGRLLKEDGEPYKVYTPFRNRWRREHAHAPIAPVPSLNVLEGKLIARSALGEMLEVPSPESFGHASSARFPACDELRGSQLLDTFLSPGGMAERYADARDVPALNATSQLSPQLRAGTIGIRTCFARAFEAAERPGASQIEKWIDELIWREFYQMILKSYPYVAERPFIDAAANVPWDDDPRIFERWCIGATGYPLVDAAMRQLNETGWMHNRLRMVVASFLTKDLLLNWQWGERYFETHLADADLAQNNGGWQWAASTGTDAAPYFRIFNPVLQSKKFDASGLFIRRMIPALAAVPDAYVHTPWEMPALVQTEAKCRIGVDYPFPVVDHGESRRRAIAAYATVLGSRAKA